MTTTIADMQKKGKLSQNYTQVCVWQSCIVAKGEEKQFEEFMKNKFQVRVNFLEVVFTAPDMKDGHPVEETGGRSDVLFAIHSDDISKFAVKRFMFQDPIRWIEDVFGNGHGNLYPARIKNYCTWNEGAIKEAEEKNSDCSSEL